jgi:hypothetical protein
MADAILTVVSHCLLTLSFWHHQLHDFFCRGYCPSAPFANITARYADVISTHDDVFSSQFMRCAVIFRCDVPPQKLSVSDPGPNYWSIQLIFSSFLFNLQQNFL